VKFFQLPFATYSNNPNIVELLFKALVQNEKQQKDVLELFEKYKGYIVL
jgi:hypothetical protein